MRTRFSSRRTGTILILFPFTLGKNHGNSNNYKFPRIERKNDKKIKCGKNLFENHNEERG